MSKLVTKNNDGVTAESFTNSYGTCAVFTKANESGGTDTWCLYAKDPQNTKNWYIFMGEHRELALESGTLDLLLPLHLITDAELLDTMFATLQPGTPYTCGLDKLPDGQTLSSLFRTFYETSGLYTVTGSDSGFTLVPRGGAQQLTFQFDEQDGSRPLHDLGPAEYRAPAHGQRRRDLRQGRSRHAAGGCIRRALHRAAAGQL